MKNFYFSIFIAFVFAFTVNAQSFPCGDQVLSDCECLGTGTLIADSEPCSFGSAENQVYLLVDVDNATVDGDADDNSIVSASANGIFTGVQTGDYSIYSLVYDMADEATVEAAAATGNNISTILDLGVEGPTGTWTSSNPNFELIVSDLATVNGAECDCPNYNLSGTITDANGNPIAFLTINITLPNGSVVSVTTNQFGVYALENAQAGEYYIDLNLPNGFSVSNGNFDANGQGGPFTIDANGNLNANIDASLNFDITTCENFVSTSGVVCNSSTYFVVLTIDFSGTSTPNGYNVSSTHEGGFNGVVNGSFIDGPFVAGTGYEYTITSLDNPGCTNTVSVSYIDCATVAIELLRFDGISKTEGNELFWSTATEYESDYFTLEYSVDGVNFKPIAQINATGNSSVQNNYSYLHADVPNGKAYYRLSETDVNGVTIYVGDIVELNRISNDLSIVNIHPVPADNYINVSYTSNVNTEAVFSIYDVSGKLVTKLSGNARVGVNEKTIDLSNLATGTYLLNIKINDKTVTQKIVKK